MYACLDILNYRFKLRKPKPSIVEPARYLLKILFTNKMIEDLNFETLINSELFKLYYPLNYSIYRPTLVYTYTRSIKHAIFMFLTCTDT